MLALEQVLAINDLKVTKECGTEKRQWSNCCCCSVTQSCPTLCNPMDCGKPGLPVPYHLFARVHVHCIDAVIHWNNSTVIKQSPSYPSRDRHKISLSLQEQRPPPRWRMELCWISWLQTTKTWILLTFTPIMCWILLCSHLFIHMYVPLA